MVVSKGLKVVFDGYGGKDNILFSSSMIKISK